MSEGLIFVLVIGALVLVAVARVFFSARAQRRREQAAATEKARNEALFRSMFPELQPLYHPERLVEFVEARIKGKANARGKREWDWNNPPGFPGLRARIAATEKGERVMLTRPDGKAAGEFLYEAAPKIGVMRVGKGKLTIDLSNRPAPRVRYWHPERQFKWSLKGWVFNTPMADEPFSTSSSETSSSSFTSSSSDSRATTAALVGAGGAFDGGGAAGGWDSSAGGGPAPEAPSIGGSESAAATAY
ncbi:MAG TPA: hypothetical protein VFV17_01545 [Usitatibacteraceae bacterium]|nr:hypothetical protein [Usitatibacteraceae bacterium]